MHDRIKEELLEKRILFLITNEVGTELTEEIISSLVYLNLENPKEDITIYINTPGIVLDCFFSLYDVFQSIEAPIRTIGLGSVYSGGANLVTSGTKGKRFSYPNTDFMIHNIQIDELCGSKKEVEEEMFRTNETNKAIIQILSKHTGNSLKKITKDCQNDYYLTSKQAIKYGLIDKIIQPTKNIPIPKRK